VWGVLILVVSFVGFFPGTTILIAHHPVDWSRHLPEFGYRFFAMFSAMCGAGILTQRRLALRLLLFVVLYCLAMLPDLPGVHGFQVDRLVCAMIDVLKAAAFVWLAREVWLRIVSGRPLLETGMKTD
jgi:hypothetical protein